MPASVRSSTVEVPGSEPILPTTMSAPSAAKSAHSSQPFSDAWWKSFTGLVISASPSAVAAISLPSRMSIFLTSCSATPSAATIGSSFLGSKGRVQNSPIASVTLVASVSRLSHGNFWIARRPLI